MKHVFELFVPQLDGTEPWHPGSEHMKQASRRVGDRLPHSHMRPVNKNGPSSGAS